MVKELQLDHLENPEDESLSLATDEWGTMSPGRWHWSWRYRRNEPGTGFGGFSFQITVGG